MEPDEDDAEVVVVGAAIVDEAPELRSRPIEALTVETVESTRCEATMGSILGLQDGHGFNP